MLKYIISLPKTHSQSFAVFQSHHLFSKLFGKLTTHFNTYLKKREIQTFLIFCCSQAQIKAVHDQSNNEVIGISKKKIKSLKHFLLLFWRGPYLYKIIFCWDWRFFRNEIAGLKKTRSAQYFHGKPKYVFIWWPFKLYYLKPEEKVCTFCVNRGVWGNPPGKKELLVLNGTNLCYLKKKTRV